MKTQRYTGLDLIRALAIFSVIGGHFFMNTGFQQAEFAGQESNGVPCTGLFDSRK